MASGADIRWLLTFQSAEFDFGPERLVVRFDTDGPVVADGAIDRIRDRLGWEAVSYGSLALGFSRSVPDEFRQLAEKGVKLGTRFVRAA